MNKNFIMSFIPTYKFTLFLLNNLIGLYNKLIRVYFQSLEILKENICQGLKLTIEIMYKEKMWRESVLDIAESYNDVTLTDVCAVAAIIISIMGPFFARKHNSIIRFTDAFNQIYTKTFSLRKQISKMLEKNYSEDFFYEIEKIESHTNVEEYILDYLTEMENFFNLISWNSVTNRTLKRLVSVAFYQHISMLYGYILWKRKKNKNLKMFVNYCRAVKK